MPFKSKEGQREYRKRRRAERTDAQRIEDNEKRREYDSKKRAELTDEERLVQRAGKSTNIEEQQRHIVETNGKEAHTKRNEEEKI